MSLPEYEAHTGCDVGAWASANDDGQLDGTVVGQVGSIGVLSDQAPA